jgi:hypothetical protein
MTSSLVKIEIGPKSRLLIDFRDAMRGLREGRGTTLLAFVLLSLTMAAGTVTFSVVDAVALRSLPYAFPYRQAPKIIFNGASVLAPLSRSAQRV